MLLNRRLPDYFISLEDKYGAHNYHPLPVVLKGKGVHLWDVMVNNIMIFLSGYQASKSRAHHPKLLMF
jgi:ornithine--oxo-acid transaminase